MGMRGREPNSNTLANQVADRVRREVVDRDLREGDFFMTTEAMAEHYGVSRGIAREAVSQLRALGVLKSRQSKGLLVGRSDLIGLIRRVLPFYDQSPEDLRALAQFRYMLELGAVGLAVRNAVPHQLQALQRLAAEYRRLVLGGGDSLDTDTCELAFHCLILEMTGNELVAGMHEVVSEYFAAAPHLNADWFRIDERVVWEHEAIVDAFRRGSPEEARVFLSRHLQFLLAAAAREPASAAAADGPPCIGLEKESPC